MTTKKPCAYIALGFSLNMLSRELQDRQTRVLIEPITVAQAHLEAQACLDQYTDTSRASCIGFKNSADVLSHTLGLKIHQNRGSIRLDEGERLLVCAFDGERLEPFAKVLPEGTHLACYVVTIGG